MMLTVRAFNLRNAGGKVEWGVNMFHWARNKHHYYYSPQSCAEKSEDKKNTNVDKTVMHSIACAPINFPALVSILCYFLFLCIQIHSLVAEKN